MSCFDRIARLVVNALLAATICGYSCIVFLVPLEKALSRSDGLWIHAVG